MTILQVNTSFMFETLNDLVLSIVRLVTRVDGVKLGVIRHNSICVDNVGSNDVKDGIVVGVRN